eukprot:SAG31_NODE_46319_length_255_cov_0.647436_1_plen_61_part_10
MYQHGVPQCPDSKSLDCLTSSAVSLRFALAHGVVILGVVSSVSFNPARHKHAHLVTMSATS